jgi:hypothetical protein
VNVAKDFIYESPACPKGRKDKVLGIFGGEPLLSPYFADYVDILCSLVPEPQHRGLWTSIDYVSYNNHNYGDAKTHVDKLLNDANGVRKGYLNWNMHTEDQKCEHHPVLISISDVIEDDKTKWELINKCWLNENWSACYSLDADGVPRFYFCEVASSFDRVMKLGIGLPVVKNVWNQSIEMFKGDYGILVPSGAYSKQINACCTRCSQPLPLRQGRRDMDMIDDISESNLLALQAADSPMVKRGDYQLVQIEGYDLTREQKRKHDPSQYIKSGYHKGNKVNERS